MNRSKRTACKFGSIVVVFFLFFFFNNIGPNGIRPPSSPCGPTRHVRTAYTASPAKGVCVRGSVESTFATGDRTKTLRANVNLLYLIFSARKVRHVPRGTVGRAEVRADRIAFLRGISNVRGSETTRADTLVRRYSVRTHLVPV